MKPNLKIVTQKSLKGFSDNSWKLRHTGWLRKYRNGQLEGLEAMVRFFEDGFFFTHVFSTNEMVANPLAYPTRELPGRLTALSPNLTWKEVLEKARNAGYVLSLREDWDPAERFPIGTFRRITQQERIEDLLNYDV